MALDANIVRAFLNDAGGIRDGVADAEFGEFGAIGLYAGGAGEVRFRKVAYKNLHSRVRARPNSCRASSGSRA